MNISTCNSFLSDKKQLAFYNHLNDLGIADNVISRTFKVDKTKTIRQTAEELSDEEFSANIDKIIFGRYGQDSKTETVEAVPEPETKAEPEPNIEPAEEEIEEQPEEPASVIPFPLPPKEKMGLEAPKTKPEEESAAPARNSKQENSFEEIVKGYMLLALLEHGINSENISLTQLDAIFDRYTKNEAAEFYRQEV